ncbi:division/cell wall cluster transcriptional repressor MraZ [Cytophagaceae bacterium ABcell3]|nr:division/cell wall cluster transcriptional repressor MraZ [Cytophagaceae bacterium ABcell3]
MANFSGEYECKLDAKGRLVLPSRLKASLPQASGNSIVVTRGFETCLLLFSLTAWNEIFSSMTTQASYFNAEARRAQRSIFRGNTEVDLDNNGRFVIPKRLQEYAKLEKEVLLVGLNDKIEIWNPEIYDAMLIQDQDEVAKLAEKYLGGKEGEA